MFARIQSPRKTALYLTLSVLVLAFAAAALAQGPQNRFGQGRGRQGEPGLRLEMLAEKLELTEEQVAAIEKIQETGREKATELRKDMMRLRNELEGEMLKDEPSEKTALQLVEKIGGLRTEMQAGRMQVRLEVRGLLTPEQRDRMLMMEQGSRRGEGRRGGHGRGNRCGNECDGSGPGHSEGRRGARGQ